MTPETAIQLFEDKKIRTRWDKQTEERYFSVTDVIEILTDSANPRDYWFKMKQRTKLEDGIELSTICRQMKLLAPDKKMRETDCANVQNLLRIIQSIPSPKAEPFKQWLAKVGYEWVQSQSNRETSLPVCPECDAKFELDAKFCQVCGYNLESDFITDPICPQCKKTHASGTKFCDFDGCKLVSPDKLMPKCVKCGQTYDDDTKFCPIDGGHVTTEPVTKALIAHRDSVKQIANAWKKNCTGREKYHIIMPSLAGIAAGIDIYIAAAFFTKSTQFVDKGISFPQYLRQFNLAYIITAILCAAALIINKTAIEKPNRVSKIGNFTAIIAACIAGIFLLLAILFS